MNEIKELIDITKEILEVCKEINKNIILTQEETKETDQSKLIQDALSKPKRTEYYTLIKDATQNQPNEKKYYVGLLDSKNHIFKYVCKSTLICDGYDVNNEIFSKLFEKNIFTSSVTSHNIKIFNQSELDGFMNSEIISYLMKNYNLGVFIFDTSIVKYDDIATDIKQYYIYYLMDKDIVFFNGFLNGKDDLKLEDNIEKAQLFNRAETIVNISKLEENCTNNRKYDIVKKDDPILKDLMKKASECV